MLIRTLFACRSCHRPASRRAFPLCSDCIGSLANAPSLCSNCGSHLCESDKNACFIPTDECTKAIHSYTARYLLIEPGYTVMKSWKKNGGLFFDQVILKSDSHFKARILRHIAIPSRTVIVPLPQRFERSWRLGRSPALAFSQMLQRETGIEIRTDLLMLRSSFSRKPRQAELRLEQRIQTPSPFVASENAIELAESRKIDSILLTDDFMTSGHTLKCAAMALKTAGFPAVHAIVLGYRPRPVVRQEESRSIPLQLPNP